MNRKYFVPPEEDAHGAWMSNERKVAAFLPWFTDDPVAEAPLKLIIMLSSHKNPLRLASKLFKSHAEEGTTKIQWNGEDNPDQKTLPSPCSLMPLLAHPVRDRDGRFKDRLPNLKSIECDHLDTLMDLNGCPSGLEELSCFRCKLIQSLSPHAACTNLRKLDLEGTKVSHLKPLVKCVKLEWLGISDTQVTDLSPLSACISLKALWMTSTGISDLRPLSGLRRLKAIGLPSGVVDLSPLGSCPHLEYLDCHNSKVTDLASLSKCSELKILNIYDCEIASLTPLHCKKLKYLNHGNLPGKTLEETKGFVLCMQEYLIPDLICFTENGDMWGLLPHDITKPYSYFL